MAEQKKKPAGGETKQANVTTTNDTAEKTKKQDAKCREWWCVVYPESAPSNWKELVQQTFTEAFISPLHDKDVNPDGQPKKPHHHVVLAWAGPTTFSKAKAMMETFGGVIQPKVIGSLRGVCRYLCHLDNPEKAAYRQEDVICYNGADYETAISLKSDKYVCIEEMQAFCDKYRITSFLMLNTYARTHRKADWFRCLCDNGAYVMREYCKSLEWLLDNKGYVPSIDDIDHLIEAKDEELSQELEVDPSTGEVTSCTMLIDEDGNEYIPY